MTERTNRKKALITGITGQDGSYLTELLLDKGYEVHGIVRRTGLMRTDRIDHLKEYRESRLFLHYGDLGDSASIISLIEKLEPDEVYNLAAQSHVRVSFEMAEYTSDVTGLGALRLLEAIRLAGLNTKFYQASTSDMFGKAEKSPQNENTPFHPRSPYACAKLYAHWMTVNYREGYNMYAVSGILYNHESPRRGENFVTRKITRTAARIKLGMEKELFLGDLNARRDWGYAKDYVRAMWLMLQQDTPNDFVIATGITHSVQDFLDVAFGYLDLNWEEYVKNDPRFYRPTEVQALVGDSTRARKELGWKPKVSFEELVKMMVDSDLKEA